MILKNIIPLSLLGRSIIIIFVPIIILVLITSVIFYQTSWNIISKRLTESVVADINVIVKLINQDLELEAINIAKEDFKMEVNLKKNSKINNISYKEERGILSKRLKQALVNLNKPFDYNLSKTLLCQQYFWVIVDQILNGIKILRKLISFQIFF